jgi:hypothetical protein
MWSYPHISETCFLWPLLGTGYIIFQRLKWDFSTLGKGLVGGSFLIFTFLLHGYRAGYSFYVLCKAHVFLVVIKKN